MTAPKNERPTLHLTGPSKGPPTADDILKLFTALTGKLPRPEDRAKVQATIDEHVAKRAAEAR